MGILYDNRGYSLVSLLMAITLLSLLFPLMAQILNMTRTHEESLYDITSIHQFFYFLQEEMKDAQDFQIRDQTLYLTLYNDDIISFQQHHQTVSRKLNNQGHLIYLRDVDYLSFIPRSYGFQVMIRTIKGDEYEKTMVLYP
ncbi:competence type IV pilus minor pilin ComGF [Virgibacillus soli]